MRSAIISNTTVRNFGISQVSVTVIGTSMVLRAHNLARYLAARLSTALSKRSAKRPAKWQGWDHVGHLERFVRALMRGPAVCRLPVGTRTPASANLA